MVGKMSGKAGKQMESVPPPPARFTLTEWYLNNRQRNRQAEDQQHLADRILAECDRVRVEANDIVTQNKNEVEHRFEVKLADIEFRKKQLEQQKKDMEVEVEALKTFRARIEDAQRALEQNAYNICNKCIALREGRLGIDLCHDDVEQELLKERDVIQGTQSLLVRTLEQVNEQLRRLRALIYTLSKDLDSKAEVMAIDKHNRALKETSLNLSIYNGNTPLDPGNVTDEEWAMYTQQTIDRAAKELVSGRPLRSYINQLLKQVIEDLWKQYYAVNEAFRRRIEEYKEAKTKFENQHFETMRQANEMTREITRLEKAIADKESFMALVHTRLGNRAQRRGIELCRDEVEVKLISEIEDIRVVVTKLQQMLSEAQASLRYLLKTQVQIEEDINIKTNSLKIDEVDCMTLRLGMDYHAY
ncbi:tektin-1 [Macrosteles quadrilineatus]|uniref:tektin-1 n=1 Tax=Macrosteles quadrilineatus TaxID=74068 RepID=UPI0023E11DCE|nr:tektin-1 [Macrosteles quadrilineatus]